MAQDPMLLTALVMQTASPASQRGSLIRSQALEGGREGTAQEGTEAMRLGACVAVLHVG